MTKILPADKIASPTPEEGAAARAWRNRHRLTPAELGELVGYSQEAIYAFERAERPAGRRGDRAIRPWVWLRYKRACAGVDAQLRQRDRKAFDWGR